MEFKIPVSTSKGGFKALADMYIYLCVCVCVCVVGKEKFLVVESLCECMRMNALASFDHFENNYTFHANKHKGTAGTCQ